MGDLVEETRALTISPEDEDFGYVARDSNLLEKALNASAKSSLAGNEGVATPEVVPSGKCGDVERRPVDGDPPDEADIRIDEKFLEDTTTTTPQPVKKGILKASSDDFNDVGILKASSDDFNDVYYDEPRRIKSYTVSPETPEKRKSSPSSSLTKNKMASKTISAGPPVKEDLPQTFQVKYLGYRDARGLWGIKHTRRPVDAMVSAAKSLKVGTVLPLVKLIVSKDGVSMLPIGQKTSDGQVYHTIDTISYGVQDLVYTRVFSMIVVKDTGGNVKKVHPFECHAFVCDSRHGARRLTYSLATAFQEYSKTVNTAGGNGTGREKVAQIKKRFAIDLRTPEEIEAELRTPQADETEA